LLLLFSKPWRKFCKQEVIIGPDFQKSRGKGDFMTESQLAFHSRKKVFIDEVFDAVTAFEKTSSQQGNCDLISMIKSCWAMSKTSETTM
jgi:hypothetical protein